MRAHRDHRFRNCFAVKRDDRATRNVCGNRGQNMTFGESRLCRRGVAMKIRAPKLVPRVMQLIELESDYRHCEQRLVRRSSTSEGGSDEAIRTSLWPWIASLRSPPACQTAGQHSTAGLMAIAILC